MLYFVSFLALALIPLALGAYGDHLATEAITDPKRHNRAVRIVWGLASIGVILAGLQQYLVYRSDLRHDREQSDLKAEFTGQLNTSLQHEDFIKGQLNGIGIIVGNLAATKDSSGLAKLAEDLKMMSSSQGARVVTPLVYWKPTREQLQAMSNADLKRYVNQVAQDLRSFDSCWAWPDRPSGLDEAMVNRMYQQAFMYQFFFVPDLEYVLARRISGPKPPPISGNVELWGTKTASGRADQLEKLALQISQ